MSEPDVTKLDLYLLLDISNEADEKEIKKAYRKKALTCHPDKHPDDPQAAQQFRQISKALEVLTDETAKKAYDRLLKARKNSQVRHRELDSKRRKLKDELEARERAAKDDVMSEMDAAAQLAKEIERVRREGSKQLEEENEKLRKQFEEELKLMNSRKEKMVHKLKVKCKSKTFDFSEENIRKYFARYGIITCLVISKKSRSALIEFADSDSTFSASKDENEAFKMTIMNPNGESETVNSKKESSHGDNEVPVVSKNINQNVPITNFNRVTPNMNDDDFESLVLRNMRLAEERRQVIKQMQEEDEKERLERSSDDV